MGVGCENTAWRRGWLCGSHIAGQRRQNHPGGDDGFRPTSWGRRRVRWRRVCGDRARGRLRFTPRAGGDSSGVRPQAAQPRLGLGCGRCPVPLEWWVAHVRRPGEGAAPCRGPVTFRAGGATGFPAGAQLAKGRALPRLCPISRLSSFPVQSGNGCEHCSCDLWCCCGGPAAVLRSVVFYACPQGG